VNALPEVAEIYAPAIIAAVRREYPNGPRHTMTGPDDLITPRGSHPAFYGCFDWHSAVEMHWALAVLVRTFPDAPFAPDARAVLHEHLTAENLRAEAAYLETAPSWERPYGWGWALQLAAELGEWGGDGDAEARAWASNLAPLATRLADGFVRWLPLLAYPERVGMHSNTAWALTRSLPYARQRAAAGDGTLLDAITTATHRLYTADRDYPFGYEPSGADFLSGGLAEADLMREVLGDGFGEWWAGFGGAVEAIATPAVILNPADGQGAHLIGLNLHRAHGFRALGMTDAADAHLAASLPLVTGGDWMAEHWLAAFAVLALR
jgi:hypothetical protein